MKMLKETWVLFVHYEKMFLRNPFWIIAGLFQPVCYLYLFAPLLTNLAGVSGGGSAINMFTPGMMVIVSLFGALFVGYSMIDYLRSGIIERLRVTTASRVSLLLGLVLRDVSVLLVQALIVIVLALPLGLEVTVFGAILCLLMMALIGLCISPASYALALAVKSEDAMGPILNFFSQPLLLLSGVLLPLTLAPLWLQNLSSVNPIKYAVDASRAIFNGDLTNPVILQAFLLLVVLVALSFWWAMRRMKKATA